MSTCGEPCDGCPNRAEHHLCDACCHDEVDAIRREERELREKLEWQAACTKALMESQERLAAELKEAREWAKERSEFAAAETEHANRWSVRAHKAEAEVERLRGLAIHPTGVTWQQHHKNFVVAVEDEIVEAYQRGAEAMRKAAETVAFTTLSLHDEPCPRSELRSAVTQAIYDLPAPKDEK